MSVQRIYWSTDGSVELAYWDVTTGFYRVAFDGTYNGEANTYVGLIKGVTGVGAGGVAMVSLVGDLTSSRWLGRFDADTLTVIDTVDQVDADPLVSQYPFHDAPTQMSGLYDPITASFWTSGEYWSRDTFPHDPTLAEVAVDGTVLRGVAPDSTATGSNWVGYGSADETASNLVRVGDWLYRSGNIGWQLNRFNVVTGAWEGSNDFTNSGSSAAFKAFNGVGGDRHLIGYSAAYGLLFHTATNMQVPAGPWIEAYPVDVFNWTPMDSTGSYPLFDYTPQRWPVGDPFTVGAVTDFSYTGNVGSGQWRILDDTTILFTAASSTYDPVVWVGSGTSGDPYIGTGSSYQLCTLDLVSGAFAVYLALPHYEWDDGATYIHYGDVAPYGLWVVDAAVPVMSGEQLGSRRRFW